MKDVYDCTTVKRLFRDGMKIKAIARTLKMSKNTVKKLIKVEGEIKYTRDHYPTKIDDYKEKITQWYLSPDYDFNGTRIYRELKKLGYDGSINPIYRYLKKLSKDKIVISRNATVRFETPYGDQAQFDWSPYKIKIGGLLIEVNCITMILSASRKKVGVFSKTVDEDSIYESIQELFDDLGGVSKELLIDNPKTLVISNKKDEEIIFNQRALNLSFHLGTELNACNPYRAKTKGKIEKPYQYIEEQFVKGSSFDSMDHLNKEFKKFLVDANNEIHGTTKRAPNEMFLEEIKHLLPLPEKRYLHKSLDKRVVSNDSRVMVDTNKYSVPVNYVGQDVKIRKIYGFKLEIYDLKMNLIDTHEIVDGKHNTKIKDSHYDAIKPRAPKSIPEMKRQFIADFKSGNDYLLKTAKILNQQSYHVREFLKLRDMYNNDDLNLILEYCVDNEVYRIEGIREVLKDKYFEIIIGEKNLNKKDVEKNNSISSDELIRETSYYEGGQN